MAQRFALNYKHKHRLLLALKDPAIMHQLLMEQHPLTPQIQLAKLTYPHVRGMEIQDAQMVHVEPISVYKHFALVSQPQDHHAGSHHQSLLQQHLA